MATIRATNDGFAVAEKDLEMRGPGELLGSRQAGVLQFRVADLKTDQDLFPAVQQTARILSDRHPEMIEPLIRRWLTEGTPDAAV